MCRTMRSTSPSRRCGPEISRRLRGGTMLEQSRMPSVLPRYPVLTDFDFFGFDGQMAKLQRNVQRVEIRSGTPEVSIVDDFIYVPMDQSGLLRREREALARADVPHVPSDPAVAI